MNSYSLAGREPRAFVGWTKEITVPGHRFFGGNRHPQYAEALAEMFGNWMAGAPLNICVGAFASKAIEHGFDDADAYSISGAVNLTR